MVALGSLLHALESRAAGSNPLPLRLPIGSQTNVLEWSVTNRIAVISYSVWYTSSTNHLSTGFQRPPVYRQFASYEAFRQYTAVQGMILRSNLMSQTDIGSTIYFVATVTYPYTDSRGYLLFSMVALNYEYDIGPLAGITSNTFLNLLPNTMQTVVDIPLLSMANIHVFGDHPYDYTWTATGSTKINSLTPPPPDELTKTGILDLNPWVSVGTNRVEITLAASGYTNVYTSFGDHVTGAVLQVPKPTLLNVTFARGSETVVESSTDLKSWTSVTNVHWSFGTNFLSVGINPALPKLFFRARSD